MKIILLLLLGLPAIAQTFVTQPTVVRKNFLSVVVLYKLSGPANAHKIQWGTTPGTYPNESVTNTNNRAVMLLQARGLPSDTTIYARVVAGAAQSNEFSFKTDPRPAKPTPPRPPAPVSWSNGRPAANGTTRTVAADCSDLQAHVRAAEFGDRIVLPAGRCEVGGLEIPSKPGFAPGRTYIRMESAKASALPPFLSRISSSDFPNMTELYNPYVNAPAVAGPTMAQCDINRHLWDTRQSAEWKLVRCGLDEGQAVASMANSGTQVRLTIPSHSLQVNDRVKPVGLPNSGDPLHADQNNWDTYVTKVIDANTVELASWRDTTVKWTSGGRLKKHVWQLIRPATGSAVPNTCAPGAWFLKDGSGDIKTRGYLCGPDGAYQHVIIDDNPSAGRIRSHIVNNGAGWWFRGIRFTYPRLPDPPEGDLGGCCQADSGNFVMSQFIDNGYIWERSLVLEQISLEVPEYYRNSGGAMFLIGPHSGVVGSRFGDVAYTCGVTFHANPCGGPGASSIVHLEDHPGGPILIHNNYFSGYGIASVLSSDDKVGAMPRQKRLHDLTLTQNEFVTPKKYQVGSPEHAALKVKLWAKGRHHFEVKNCHRCKLEGNIFRNTWSSINPGGSISFFDFESGWHQGSMNCASGVCSPGNPGWGYHGYQKGERILSLNSGTVYTVQSVGSSNFQVSPADTVRNEQWVPLDDPPGAEDISVVNNVFESVTHMLQFGGGTGRGSVVPPAGAARVDISNNLVKMQDGFCGFWPLVDGGYGGMSCGMCASGPGLGACGGGWMRADSNKTDWNLSRNTVINNSPMFYSYGYIINHEDATWLNGGFGGNYHFRNNIVVTPPGIPHLLRANIGAQDRDVAKLEFPNQTDSVVVSGNVIVANANYSAWPGNVTYRADQRGPAVDRNHRPIAVLQRDSTGAPVGADLDAIAAATGRAVNAAVSRVTNLRVTKISAGSATIAYTAPDEKACTVRHGPNFTKSVADSGGPRERSVTIKPATSGAYPYQVQCSADQEQGSFTAK